jgi:hypothetical protein
MLTDNSRDKVFEPMTATRGTLIIKVADAWKDRGKGN